MIRRPFKRSSFTIVENIIIRDSSISAKAKGVFIYLLSLPEDWDVRVKEIVTHFTDGINGIRSGLKELREHGYLSWENRRDETGKVTGIDYIQNEMPDNKLPRTENQDTENVTLLSTKKKLNTNNTNNINSSAIKKIVEYLNTRCDKHFKPNNQQTIRLLNARLAEGYKVGDFEKVIDIKADRWKDKIDYDLYLRPKTLFGNKFESYVNEIDIEGSQNEVGTLKELL